MSTICIIGAGSWGTALAILIARNGHKVRLWGRDDYMEEMSSSRVNQSYLPSIRLPDLIEVHANFESALEDIQNILVAVPSHAFEETIKRIHQIKPNGIRLAWATKGLADNNQFLHQVVWQIYGNTLPIAVVAGPSFAKEVALGLPTAITITCNDSEFEHCLVAQMHGKHFRVYQQTDFIGVQICGAVKNPLAVATGISDGLGYGTNARTALLTRGLAEMKRLGLAMGALPDTFMGLAGVGDLVLTCTDNQSRNRRYGFAVGQGLSLAEAEKSIGQVVEGKLNAFKVKALAHQFQIEMPIIEQVCAVLDSKITPYESVEQLFARHPKHEAGNVK